MNEHTIERRCRLLFDSCRVQFGSLKTSSACTTMDAGRTVVTLPHGFDDDYTLRTLLHELVHLAHPGELAALGGFEEDFLNRVIEPRLMFWLVGKPRRHAWWVKRIRDLRGTE